MRQKDASETEGEGLQNSGQTNNAIWDRNVFYDEAPRKRIEVGPNRDKDARVDVRSNGQIPDEERTHARDIRLPK